MSSSGGTSKMKKEDKKLLYAGVLIILGHLFFKFDRYIVWRSYMMKKQLSVYFLFVIGLILVIEPFLPQYEFSPFWFSLGVISVVTSLYDLFKRMLK